MKYAVEMGSGFIKIGSGVKKLKGGDTQTHKDTHTDSNVIS
jgi:hypothetical protein